MSKSDSRKRNISFENLKKIYEFIDNFHPTNVQEERNLAILKYAYEKNMSAESIYALNDPRMISYSNENYGKRISATSIRKIIKSYDLEYEKRTDYSKRASYKRRNEYANYYQKGNICRQKVCACCGRKDNIELHHIIPIYFGGKDVYYNLIYLCHDCHVLIHRMLKDYFESINTVDLLSNKKEDDYEQYGYESKREGKSNC